MHTGRCAVKAVVLLPILAGSAFLPSPPCLAATNITLYTTYSEWSAAAGPQDVTLGFGEYPPETVITTQYASYGVTFSGTPNPPYVYPNPRALLNNHPTNPDPFSTIEMTFDPPVRDLAMDVGGSQSGGATLTVYSGGDVLWNGSVPPLPQYLPLSLTFFGFITTPGTTITHAVIDPGTGSLLGCLLDNLRFTANHAPTAPTVDVTPDGPKTGDNLSVSAGGSTDEDGDAVTYSYAWYKGAAHQSAYDGQTTVPASATAKGETWKCLVTPSDGKQEGAAGEDSVVIGNTAPSGPDKPTVSPASPKTGDDLTLSEGTGSADPDPADTVTYEYEWSNDSWASTVGGKTLPSSNTTKGDGWEGRVRATDGTDHSAWVESDSVVIGNTAPTLEWVGQPPFLADGHHPQAGTPDVTTFNFCVKVTDPDGTQPRSAFVRVQRLEDGRAWQAATRLRLRSLGGSWTEGMLCGARASLPNGVYRYQFGAQDDVGARATGEPTRWHRGPDIVAPPQLWCTALPGRQDSYLDPETGTAMETRFSFCAQYTDGEGTLPTVYSIELQKKRPDGTWHDFRTAAMKAWGGGPSGGKYYTWQGKLRAGEYRHRFVFEDDDGPATGADSQGPDATQWQAGPLVSESTTDAVAACGAMLQSLAVLPSAGGAQIVFSLSAPMAVDARILNIAGRPVKTICRARDCEAGANTLLWNATSDTGLAAPNGMYLIEVMAKAGDGARIRALGQVRVSR